MLNCFLKNKNAVNLNKGHADHDGMNSKNGSVSNLQQSYRDALTNILAEFIGTGLLMFLGCMGNVSFSGHIPTHFEKCITFGFTVLIVIQIFGCVSGAHINPSVTVAAYIYDMLSLRMAAAYILAQFFGAYLGFGILKLVSPANAFEKSCLTDAGVCSTVPHQSLSGLEAFFVEFLATMILVFMCCGVWDPRNLINTDSVPLRFGFAVTGLSIAAGPYTGASMNPARSVAPALWNNDYRLHWVYWLGPLSAAVFASVVYKFLFRRDTSSESRKEKDVSPLAEIL